MLQRILKSLRIPRLTNIDDQTSAVFTHAEQDNRVTKNKYRQVVILVKKKRKSPLWEQLLGTELVFRVGPKKVALKRRLLLLQESEDDDDNDEPKDEEKDDNDEPTDEEEDDDDEPTDEEEDKNDQDDGTVKTYGCILGKIPCCRCNFKNCGCKCNCDCNCKCEEADIKVE